MVRLLLIRDPTLRLGSGQRDASEIKEHTFFSDVDWRLLATGNMPPPWIPTFAGSVDTSQFDQEFTSMNPIGIIGYLCMLYDSHSISRST